MAIKSISRAELKTLSEKRGSHCVSIYLRAPRAGEETRESPQRLKILLQQARERFDEIEADKRQVAQLLNPLERLIDDYPFWQHQHGGAGLFSTDDFFETHQLSYEPSDQAIVGPRFHIKPLLPMWADEGEFLLLALSKNSVKLYRASRHSLKEIPIENAPQSMAEALKFDDPEKSLHVHVGESATVGQQTGITHGHGAAKEDTKERTRRYFNHVDRGLKPYLSNERIPLLLAGVDYYLPIYREANSYPHLVEDVVSGNPEEVPSDELRKAAWEKMEPIFKRAQEQALAAITQGITNGQATDDLESAVASACQGRADKCFVALDEHAWGNYSESNAKIKMLGRTDKAAIDLLDLAAAETLSKGGDVFPVSNADQVPGKGSIAVLNRF